MRPGPQRYSISLDSCTALARTGTATLVWMVVWNLARLVQLGGGNSPRIERPKVRTGRSVNNLNTLIYSVINAKALQRARSINASLLGTFQVSNEGGYQRSQSLIVPSSKTEVEHQRLDLLLPIHRRWIILRQKGSLIPALLFLLHNLATKLCCSVDVRCPIFHCCSVEIATHERVHM